MWSLLPFLIGFLVLITLAFRLLLAPPNLKALRRRNPQAADRLAEELAEEQYGRRYKDSL